MKFWRLAQLVAIVAAVAAIVFAMGLATYFDDTRPIIPDLLSHRIYAEVIQGRVIYLTKIEHYSIPILYLFFGTGFILAAWIGKSKLNNK